MFVGLSRVNQGRMSEGLADFEHGIVLARRNGDHFWEPRLVSNLGYVHRELGAVEKARAFDTRALALARESPSPWALELATEVEPLLNLCIDSVRAGDAEGAVTLLATLEAGTARSDWLRWMNELRVEAVAAEHYTARGAFDAALERASRLSRIATRLRARGYACTAERLRGEVALGRRRDERAAAARLTQALGALDAYPAPLETWKSRRVLGLLQRRLGNEAAARSALAAAAIDVDTIARGTDDAALREGFLASPAVREVLTQAGRA